MQTSSNLRLLVFGGLLTLMFTGCINSGRKPIASFISPPPMFSSENEVAAHEEVVNLDGSTNSYGAMRSAASSCRSGFS